MSNFLIKIAVRSLFTLRSRRKALQQCFEIRDKYLALAKGVSDEVGQMCIKVPPMRGVDEDMRAWSFFMILEHNVIVNQSITATVERLARGEPLGKAARIDPKKDVMPSLDADRSQVDRFADSIENHLKAVEGLKNLRGTGTSLHPVFGKFDAHKWNCMFGFHLSLHYPQALYVVNEAEARKLG